MSRTKIGALGYGLALLAPLAMAVWYVLQPNDLMPLQPLDDALVSMGMIGSSLWVGKNFQA